MLVTNQYQEITAAACLTHIGRKFTDIIKAGITCPNASYFIKQVGQLYHYEEKAKHMTYDEQLELRQKNSAPIVEELDTWINETLKTTLPNTALYKALTHAQTRWPSIKVYLTAGNIPIDNNHIERTIRPIAIGRKNWLFFGSLAAGEAMTGIMSLLATAKINGLDPAKWLLDTLLKLPNWLNSRLDELLPIVPQPSTD